MSTPSTSSPTSNPLIDAFCQRLHEAQVTEYQFHQEANFIRAFRDSTPDLLLQLSAEGTVLNVNCSPKFKLFHDTAAILQRNITELLPTTQAQALCAAMECTLREQKPTRCEWTLPLEQTEHHFEVRVAYLRADRVLVIVRDSTAHHEALEQLRELPRQLLNAQEEERRRLSRDLHDEIGQDLTAIVLMVNRAKTGATDPIHATLEETEAALQTLTRKVRHLAQDLRPTALDELGLAAALDTLLGRYTQQTSLSVEWRLPEAKQRFPPEIEIAAYRIVQEALTNVARHAQAHHVKVDVHRQGGRLLVQISDDGRGFDAAATLHDGANGILGMSERAILLGGTLAIRSRPGQGTRILAELPVNGQPERTGST